MTLQAFIALWTHRYHKYSHIAKAHLRAYWAWLYFCWKKRNFEKGKPLIAIIRTEHFGDIVAAEPLARHIRALYPSAHIVWFVKPAYRELIDTNPAIDESFPEFCVTQRCVLLRTGVFGQVFELQFRNNNHCPTCQVFLENPTALARGINVHTYFNFGNLLEVFAQTAGLTLPTDDQPRLYLQDRHRQKVDSLHLPSDFVVIHCQSNYAPKDWPAGRWEALIEQLSTRYPFAIMEVGLRSNLSVSSPAYRNLCGQLSILETAEVIRRARYFIGLDSGPSHLANAVGTFGFILMGSLNEFPAYNPYSGAYGRQQNCVLIRREGQPCAQLPLEVVQEAIDRKLEVASYKTT
ncbi:glycosyltransferase family 9 protein [Salmonirosea aquatica]|uniref:ADP-heptose--LPS heptosyltransferase n=1 Tax=Salmonirosea aquatica TaxID=2654236 RepID=A0A7C9FYM6_9BACT|nr:ADP-heptose--LPS heptosyltransferase [Cytophagaceae bacterium SJW1-29]